MRCPLALISRSRSSPLSVPVISPGHRPASRPRVQPVPGPITAVDGISVHGARIDDEAPSCGRIGHRPPHRLRAGVQPSGGLVADSARPWQRVRLVAGIIERLRPCLPDDGVFVFPGVFTGEEAVRQRGKDRGVLVPVAGGAAVEGLAVFLQSRCDRRLQRPVEVPGMVGHIPHAHAGRRGSPSRSSTLRGACSRNRLRSSPARARDRDADRRTCRR